MKRTLMVAGVLVGLSSSFGETYIVPPDIDLYKAKTDQTFFDLYQNPKSVFSKSVLGANFQAIATSGKLTNSTTILKVKQANTQGMAIMEGTSVDVTAGNIHVRLSANREGELSITPLSGEQVVGDWVIKTTYGSPWCSASSKYGCTTEKRLGNRELLNAVTGEYRAYSFEETRSRSCSKYGCGSYGDWKFAGNVKLVKQAIIDLKSAIVKGEGGAEVLGAVPTKYNPILTEEQLEQEHTSIGGKYG